MKKKSMTECFTQLESDIAESMGAYRQEIDVLKTKLEMECLSKQKIREVEKNECEETKKSLKDLNQNMVEFETKVAVLEMENHKIQKQLIKNK